MANSGIFSATKDYFTENLKMHNKRTMNIVLAAAIAALYATLTILQNLLLPGSASMAVQFRVSEVLTVFSVFTSAAVPGLTIGCILANISSLSSLGPYDLIFGSLASFFAALSMYTLRNVRIFKLPVFAALMPALMNGLFVGFEIDFFFINQGSFDFADFLVQGGLVAIGELAVLFVLGLPLCRLIEVRELDKKLHLN